jgi:secondary thiamine-phosphate synthase enzyme
LNIHLTFAPAASAILSSVCARDDNHRNPGRLHLCGDLAGQTHPVLIAVRVTPSVHLRLGFLRFALPGVSEPVTFRPFVFNGAYMLITFPTRQNQRLEARHRTLHLHTETSLQFIDLTAELRQFVDDSGVINGLVNVQTRHTTTAIIVNENEPLLLDDLKETLERLAPQTVSYAHDDFNVRTENLTPDERPNGHAHCKALFLRSSETLNIMNGELDLGRWQRVFFLELDGARPRTISLSLLGQS